MLEKLFTSRTRVRVLKILLFDPKEFHLRGLARIVNVSPIYLSKELNNLTELNIIKKRKRANLNLYSLNQKCIYIKELKQIFLKTDYLGEQIRQELEAKVGFAFIYGSFAQGKENGASDIDLFVVAKMKEDAFITIIQKLEKNINREINYVLWTPSTFEQRAEQGHHLLRTICNSKILMLVGNEHELRKKIK